MSRTAGKPKRLEIPRRSNSVSPEAKILSSKKLMAASSIDPGAVGEEHFIEAFKDYPMLKIASGADLDRDLVNINAVLSKPSDEWEKRILALKRLRGLIMADAASYPEFQIQMRYLDVSLGNAVKDLRSQLVREAAFTVAFIAEKLGIKSERTIEMTLPSLLTIIPSSIKVISTSGTTAIRLILNYVPSPKLLPIITQEYLSSKSKETRRACCDFTSLCLDIFPKSALEKHLAGIRELVKRGLSDADSDARAMARKAYASFAIAFPNQASEMYHDLDAQKRKLIDEAVRTNGNHSDSASTGSREMKLPKSTTLDNMQSSAFKTPAKPPSSVFRSVSAVDSAAAKRARANLLPAYRVTPSAGVLPSNLARTAVPQLQRSIRRYPAKAQTTQKMPGMFLDKKAETSTSKNGADPAQPEKYTENLNDIIANLASANWNIKRDAVSSLQQYMLRGKSLTLAEMEMVMTAFTRLLNESSNRLLVIYLETLYDFVRIYALQLGSWLFTLLVKIWNKQSSDLSDSINEHIQKLLDLLRKSFPVEVQIQHVMRCLTDHNIPKNKTAILSYFITLIQTSKLHAEDLRNASLTRLGISRLVTWVYDPKNSEDVRQNSQLALVLLNEINSKEFVAVLDTLEQDLHDKAVKLIACYPKRPSVVISDQPRTRSPGISNGQAKTPSGKSPLKNLSAGSGSGSSPVNDENRKPGKSPLGTLRRSAEIQPSFGYRTKSSPVPAYPVAEITTTRFAKMNMDEQKEFLLHWSDKFQITTKNQQYQMLTQLEPILQEMTEEFWAENFMVVMPLLYNVSHIAAADTQIAAKILGCLTVFIRLQPERVRSFPELTIVNIFEIQRAPSTSVTQAAEDCIRLAARVFPCEVIVKILMPIITNELEPENVLAVRFFSLMCRELSAAEILPVLPSVLPVLVKAFTESSQSTMRKECCYALIYAKLKVGEDVVSQYTEQLPFPKIRLMNVYTKRIIQEGELEPEIESPSA